jgi:predicted ATPase
MSTASSSEMVTAEAQANPPFLRRVRIRGYKSIAYCDVALEPLTILVGRNASGKSNFLDALAFVQDAMDTNITEATRRHGGWRSILSRASPDGRVSFQMEVSLAPGSLSPSVSSGGNQPIAEYGFVLREGPSESPVLLREWFGTLGANGNGNPRFDLTGTYDPSPMIVNYKWNFHHPQVPCSQEPTPRPDRLWVASFGNRPFLDLSDGLRFSGYYNFLPQAIRQVQKPTPGAMLDRDGKNLASLIETVREIDESAVARVGAYLSAVVREVERFEVVRYGDYETVRFWLRTGKPGEFLEFDAASMSDGTLRALASLMAAFQLHRPSGPTVIGIEEPETALHPAAMRALVDALDEAALRTQVLLTTHSPEMLDNPTLRPENIRVVQLLDGRTVIAPVDEASVDIVRRKRNTLGGLERDNLLEADLDDLDRQRQRGQTPLELPA